VDGTVKQLDEVVVGSFMVGQLGTDGAGLATLVEVGDALPGYEAEQQFSLLELWASCEWSTVRSGKRVVALGADRIGSERSASQSG
jgi:hypothetical protein